MSSVLALWRAQWISPGSALRQDSRARITLAINPVVDIAASFWAFNTLSGNVAQWQMAGQIVLVTHLWLLCLYVWAGICFFAVIGVISQGFGNGQAILLMSLPLSPAIRLRALYGLILFTGVGSWTMLANILTGIALGTELGWQALPWLLLLNLGVSATASISLFVTLLVIRFVVPHIKCSLAVLAIVSASAGVVVILFRASKYSLHVTFPIQLMPVLTSAFYVSLLLLILGPFAGSAGSLYQRAFYALEGRSARRTALMLPGVRLVSAWMSRSRTLLGALLYKGLLNQSRSFYTWGRAAILGISVALFPLLQKVMLFYGFSSLAQVSVYSSLVAILAVLEYAAYAISSEGARISYYVLAPFTMARFLRARLMSFLLPVLSIGLVVCFALSWWQRLSLYDASRAIVLMALLLVGYTSFIVWGSAFDLDSDQVAEGVMQTLMLEELPVTPRRLQLLGLSIVLLAGMVLLIVKLLVVWAIMVLALLDAVVCIGLGKISAASVSHTKV